MEQLSLSVLVLTIYLLPFIIAFAHKRPDRWVIFAVNVTLGWTVIGWVGALMMALGVDTIGSSTTDAKNDAVEEVSKVAIRESTGQDSKFKGTVRAPRPAAISFVRNISEKKRPVHRKSSSRRRGISYILSGRYRRQFLYELKHGISGRE